MAVGSEANVPEMQVVRDPKDFDPRSGNLLERQIFNHRLVILLVCLVSTVFFGFHATKLEVNASFDKMIPRSHPYIQNYFEHREDLKGLGNAIRVVVENTEGDIFDPEYQEVLRQINDALYLTPGVDRPFMKSLWTPGVRWSAITEEGVVGGQVMPNGFDGSPAKMEQLRANIARTGLAGALVGNDYRSSMVLVPLLDRYGETGLPLDYGALSRHIEEKIRALQTDKVKVHVIGFAKLVGDLIDGLTQVMGFFGISALIAGVIIFLYTRCFRSTLLLVGVSLLGVVWLLGVLRLLGFVLDPYSILVPFLIFAIGLSHGAQKMNGIMQDVGRGTHKYVAARYTFRRLFLAGLTALLTNVVGFAVLMIIDIPVIQELALTTSLGVGILIFTKLVLGPVALSYVGVSPAAARRSVREYSKEDKGSGMGAVWQALDRFTTRRWAAPLVCVSLIIGTSAAVVSLTFLQIGDLDAGAPELRPDSRYNRDNAYITSHYGLSSDQFAVIVHTPDGDCDQYKTLVAVERLSSTLRHVPGVQATSSVADLARVYTAGLFEGYPKWVTLSRNQDNTNKAVQQVQLNAPELINRECTVTSVIAYLADHKADTLSRVLKAVEQFAAENNSGSIRFLPAAGTSGIEAVTNIVVKQANYRMLGLLYVAVIVLCFITFRSWRAVIVAVVPLVITSFLCEALMVALDIGIKVATLPVIALGVGVGVDYALYLLSVQLALQRRGQTLAESYRQAVLFTGKVVALVGLTLGAGVITWVWSPIKFQADMGILLTFMFVWNMLGALVLIPALSHFLLRDKRTEEASYRSSGPRSQLAPPPPSEGGASGKLSLVATDQQGDESGIVGVSATG
jgi:predicted RND superfamily exporter protein